jgi:Pyridine nucleotide-disulphide oxidoreductase, dimerisation domain
MAPFIEIEANAAVTQATDEKTGFMKVVVSASDDRILGFTMIGSEAGEVLAVVQTAMMSELPYTRLRDAVFSHLTWPKVSAFSSPPFRSARLGLTEPELKSHEAWRAPGPIISSPASTVS